jgi:hypothetical protein
LRRPFAALSATITSVQGSLKSFDVFVNCPFDQEFKPCFEALIFSIIACGYKVRCALEDDDGANIRFEKLRRLVGECPRSIHDLSRVELGANDLPRFNMPFELGMAIGAKYYGGRSRRNNTALIMVSKQYVLPAYLSDLAGNDPLHHNGDPRQVVRIVGRYLHRTPEGKLVPGAQALIDSFVQFNRDLPKLATEAGRTVEEVDAFTDYRVYLVFVEEFLRAVQQSGG